MTHLHEFGIVGVPRTLGYDEIGRQVVTFMKGHVSPDPSDLDMNRLADVGRLIRSIHEASESFLEPIDAKWEVPIKPDKEELICHNDLAPWNLVRNDDQLAFIDWDGAGPGSRLWDLAYAAHGFVPLAPAAGLDDGSAAERLSVLIDGYCLDLAQRRSLLELLVPRIRSMFELLWRSAENGTEPWSRLWSEGHGQVCLENARYAEQRMTLWRIALGV